MSTKPTMIELNMGELEETLRRAETALSQEDYARLKLLAESYACLTGLVGDKNTSIARLRKIIFGAKTEKTAAVVGQRSDCRRRKTQLFPCSLQKTTRVLQRRCS